MTWMFAPLNLWSDLITASLVPCASWLPLITSSVLRAASRDAVLESQKEMENLRRQEPRHRNRRQFFKTKFSALLRRQRVDFFFRNEEQRVMSALVQDFGDCESGKQMTAGSAACDDDV